MLQRQVQVSEVAHVAAAKLSDEPVRVALSFQDEVVEEEVTRQTTIDIQTSSDLGTSTSTDALLYVAGPSLPSETSSLVPVTDSIFGDPDILTKVDTDSALTNAASSSAVPAKATPSAVAVLLVPPPSPQPPPEKGRGRGKRPAPAAAAPSAPDAARGGGGGGGGTEGKGNGKGPEADADAVNRYTERWHRKITDDLPKAQFQFVSMIQKLRAEQSSKGTTISVNEQELGVVQDIFLELADGMGERAMQNTYCNPGLNYLAMQAEHLNLVLSGVAATFPRRLAKVSGRRLPPGTFRYLPAEEDFDAPDTIAVARRCPRRGRGNSRGRSKQEEEGVRPRE